MTDQETIDAEMKDSGEIDSADGELEDDIEDKLKPQSSNSEDPSPRKGTGDHRKHYTSEKDRDRSKRHHHREHRHRRSDDDQRQHDTSKDKNTDFSRKNSVDFHSDHSSRKHSNSSQSKSKKLSTHDEKAKDVLDYNKADLIFSKSNNAIELPVFSAAQVDPAEAEDGEILEEGELNDEEEIPVKSKTKEERHVSPPKSSRDDSRSKRDKKRSDHKDRKKDSDDREKRKRKYVDMDSVGEESNAAPAWGSGFQGARPRKHSPPNRSSKQAKYSSSRTSNKKERSPPGIYDSPSYSEDSAEESINALGLTDGYIDPSVEANEKEGIFKKTLSLKKRKKKDRNEPRSRSKRSRDRENDRTNERTDKRKRGGESGDAPACRFYVDGKCSKGSSCQFNHDVEKQKRWEVCKYHLTVKGCHKDGCPYMHQDFPCKYYHTGAKCYSGDRCKFSHEPLTEDSRRALESRVNAEDIVDMSNPDDYDYRFRNRPSLLGSPPRHYQEIKKIPSLFDIDVQPVTPKQSPSQNVNVKPSGFYNEANVSPTPGQLTSSSSSPATMTNSPNMNTINNSIQTPNIDNNAGSMQPMRSNLMGSQPGALATNQNMLNGPNMLPSQILNNQQQRLPFMGPGQPRNSGNSLPVLNVLGAIIREAAMSVPVQNLRNMNPSNIVLNNLNLNNANNGMLTFGPNNMNHNIGQSGMNSNMNQNIVGNMNLNNIGPSNIERNNINSNIQNSSNLGGNVNSSNESNVNNSMGHSNESNFQKGFGEEKDCSDASIKNETADDGDSGIVNPGKEVGIMDVDYRLKPNPPDPEETSQELSELDSIRRKLQEQIDEEDANNVDMEDIDERQKKPEVAQDVDMRISPVNEGTKNGDQSEATNLDAKSEDVENPEVKLEIPSHLPKKQRELFIRIQQQQALRDKEREKLKDNEDVLNAEKKDDTDWYSDEEQSSEDSTLKPKITDLLKNLDKEAESKVSAALTMLTGATTSILSATTTTAPSSTASTFNIMQMINAIKSQTSNTSTVPPSQIESNYSESPASPPPEETARSDIEASLTQNDPPVISARPLNPLRYAAVKLNLALPKPYSQLPKNLEPSHPMFKNDPRIKWYIQYTRKYEKVEDSPKPKEKETDLRRSSVEEDKAAKISDPRLKRNDPRLINKSGDSPKDGTKSNDPRLQKTQVRVDPRLSKLPQAKVDPRLNRQNQDVSQGPNSFEMKEQTSAINSGVNIQNRNAISNSNIGFGNNQLGDPIKNGPLNNQQGGLLNNQIGGPMNNQMGGTPSSQMGGLLNNQIGGPLNNQIGGPLSNQIGGPLNNQMDGSLNNQMGGPSNNQMGGLLNNQMSGLSNNQLGGPLNNQIGGPLNNQIGGPASNQMGGLLNNRLGGSMNSQQGGSMNNQISGPLNNRMGGPMNNQMGGPMNNQMGGPMNNQMGGPMNNQMGGSLNSPNNNQMSRPLNNQMGGPINNQMGGLRNNQIGGPMSNQIGGSMNSQMGGPINNQIVRPMVNSMGLINNQIKGISNSISNIMNSQAIDSGNMLRGPINNQIGGPISNQLSGPMNNPIRGHLGNQFMNNQMRGTIGNSMRGSQMNNQTIGTSNSMGFNQVSGGPNQSDRGTIGGSPNVNSDQVNSAYRPSQDSNVKDPTNVSNDPRIKSRDPRSANINSSEPVNVRLRPQDPRAVKSRDFANAAKNESRMELPYQTNLYDDKPALKIDGIEPLPPLNTSTLPTTSFKDNVLDSQKPSLKFDYRNDPRFKRIKRAPGQRKDSTESNSPQGNEQTTLSITNTTDVEASSLAFHTNSETHFSRRDPRVDRTQSERNNASPALPDTLQDFDLPDSNEEKTEPDINMKDIFKTIDPTASPFC